MKIGTYDIDRKRIYLGSAVLIAIIVVVFLSWPKPKPYSPIPVINAAQTAMELQFKQQLADKDIQIKDAKTRIESSERRYATLVIKYADLQKEKDNVKSPVNNAELRDRFTALGYTPTPLAVK
jgi:hypothetical protein